MNDHYKQGKHETVEKQEAIARWLSDAGIPADRIAHVTTFVKYIDRMGEKEGEPLEKDARKAADYACRAITGKWIHENHLAIDDDSTIHFETLWQTGQVAGKVKIGDVRTFPSAKPDKEQALKPLEEAAEVLEAWKGCKDSDLESHVWTDPTSMRQKLIDECCDVVQATCNLLASIDVTDLTYHMARCAERNRERGRM